MNRQIKFRAWDNINKKWMLGYEYPNLGGFSMHGECMMFGEYSKALNSFSLKDLGEFIVDEWTGLQDKNGKDIYEGDVVKDPYGMIGIVVMQNGSYKLKTKEKTLGFGSYAKQCEIIGNVHENAELLTT